MRSGRGMEWWAAALTVTAIVVGFIKWLKPMSWLSQLVPMWFLLLVVGIVLVVAVVPERGRRKPHYLTTAVPIVVAVPRWADYVSDSMFGCVWQWMWCGDSQIENLTALCPTDGCLNELASVHRPGAPDPDNYRCPRCGFTLEARAHDPQIRSLYQMHERVKQEIRRRVRTGEFKSA